MKSKQINVGDRAGKLVVVKDCGIKILPCGEHRRYYLCKCDCGNEVEVAKNKLVCQATKSCGCLIVEEKQNRSCANQKDKRFYNIRKISQKELGNHWKNMMYRCYKKSCNDYRLYGARGITVCEEWQYSFDKFKDWALSNGYQKGLTLDRIDVNGNYEPNNCRWATVKEQNRNRQNTIKVIYNSKQIALSEFAEIHNIKYYNAINWHRQGYGVEEMIEKNKILLEKRG